MSIDYGVIIIIFISAKLHHNRRLLSHCAKTKLRYACTYIEGFLCGENIPK